MTKFFNLRNLYKLIFCIFIVYILLKVKCQLISIKNYNMEISELNGKISSLEEQINSNDVQSDITREKNEDIARKNLKMYYPNETPYKGY